VKSRSGAHELKRKLLGLEGEAFVRYNNTGRTSAHVEPFTASLGEVELRYIHCAGVAGCGRG
jgi:hypothetical protein